MLEKLEALKATLEGEFYTDQVIKTLYATDASVYREMPLAVAVPKTKADLFSLVKFANQFKIPLIPRTAGTSLAGQVVGSGLVVDVSKYFKDIIELNVADHWVKVQPGVNLDELNQFLAPHGLFFGPETSTSNRCMIGGMVGNNSCGSHSIIYGTTRDHLLELDVILSDGTETTFKALNKQDFEAKTHLDTLEGKIYRFTQEMLSNIENQNEIRKEFPKRSIRRRNTGYAIDELLETALFSDTEEAFNMCKLLAGSEGTLAFSTAIKLNLVPAPAKIKGALVVQLHSIDEACKATIIARKYNPGAIELLDDVVLQCTKQNIDQLKNRHFILGDPEAVIVVEWARESKEEIDALAQKLELELRSNDLGYHFPQLFGVDINAVWSLRKAGLGLLANVPGDPKAVACIEDTAVDIHDQADFIKGFKEILAKYHKESVFYAHIGDGEIHLRPILDLKKEGDRHLFHQITEDVAQLVKQFKGSLSGEHGDGRVRGEFIRKMIGNHNYNLLLQLKKTWDPDGLFNPHKIVDTPKMNEQLRYEENQVTKEIPTLFDFSNTDGILRMAEKCNGSGDCRKSHLVGGTMCPSFMATRNEKDTTRARANILREFLTRSEKLNPFDHKEIYEVMDLCLSCKGCKSECPSNVDVATLKAEFLHHYYEANGIPFRTNVIAHFVRNTRLAAKAPKLYNFFMTWGFSSGIAKKILGIAPKRQMPLLHAETLFAWIKKHPQNLKPKLPSQGQVHLFVDEFTDLNDTPIGIKAIELLVGLGYEVLVPKQEESGRTFLSKGLVKKAQALAQKNVELLYPVVSKQVPLLGIEPSAILSFRDEYPKLVSSDWVTKAQDLAKHCLTIEEFLANEMEVQRITAAQFTTEVQKIKLHGHCHQKALSSVVPTKKLLSLPKNYQVELIPSGCCGMAGSFGYEVEHYDISMQVGEMVLFPSIRKAEDYLIAAPGTSCRHQIKDGTQRLAFHPIEILHQALVRN